MAARLLIETNVRWLHQALSLLDRLDDACYSTSPSGFSPHRAGGHMRHILEFYQAFEAGLASGQIDYDARPRNASVETSRVAASAAIRSIISFLENSPAVRRDTPLRIRMEDAPAGAAADISVQSSTPRELQFLSSHTIHHFALIAITLRLHGIEMDPEFGVAPSTLRHMASQAEAA